MSVDHILAALRLPPEARVDKRVPKTLLLEQGAPTAADKRLLRDGIEEFTWIAALKPTTGGPAAYRDDVRDYPEIAVLQVTLRPEAKRERLHALIHRAIPYPCLLVSRHGEVITLSLAHKRRSQGEAAAWVTDAPEVIDLHPAPEAEPIREKFLATLALDSRPVEELRDLYQGWIDAVLALRVARLTGLFLVRHGPEAAHACRDGLDQLARLNRELASVRLRAAKEKQIARRVALGEKRKLLEGFIATLINKF